MATANKFLIASAGAGGGAESFLTEITSSTYDLRAGNFIVDSEQNIVIAGTSNNNTTGFIYPTMWHLSSDGATLEKTRSDFDVDLVSLESVDIDIDSNDYIYFVYGISNSNSGWKLFKCYPAGHANSMQYISRTDLTQSDTSINYRDLRVIEDGSGDVIIPGYNNNISDLGFLMKVNVASQARSWVRSITTNVANTGRRFEYPYCAINPSNGELVCFGTGPISPTYGFQQQNISLSLDISGSTPSISNKNSVGLGSTSRTGIPWFDDDGNVYNCSNWYDDNGNDRYEIVISKYNSSLVHQWSTTIYPATNPDTDFDAGAGFYDPVGDKIYAMHGTKTGYMFFFELDPSNGSVSGAVRTTGTDDRLMSQRGPVRTTYNSDIERAHILFRSAGNTGGTYVAFMQIDPSLMMSLAGNTYSNWTFTDVLSSMTIDTSPSLDINSISYTLTSQTVPSVAGATSGNVNSNNTTYSINANVEI